MFAALPLSIQSAASRMRDGLTKFVGGFDQETPGWTVSPGLLRDALNYEVAIEDGYRDIRGYERYDGQPKPSAASYMILDVTISGSIVVGDTVTGAVTGDTGLVIAVDTYPDDPTQSYLVLTKVVGDFDDDDEDLEVSAVVEGNVDMVGYTDSAPTTQRDAQYKNLAADEYRSDIAAVPGEGDVWGGFSLGSNKYAIRNKTGGATAALQKATAAGWSEVALGYEIEFTSGGTYEIQEGDTVTGATSTQTAVVSRVQVTSGDWSTGDAAGWLTLETPSGTLQAENLDVGANLNVATIAGDASAITLQPDGRLDYDVSNFADTQGPDRVYGADGVNNGWEFDGTVFAKIRTGMTDDTPDHVVVHKNQLIYSFDGSIQHSGIGEPFSWSVVLGASEIATGFTITGFQVEPGAEGNAALLVACRQRLFTLYGNDVSDWNLVRYRKKVGAYEWTIQQVAYTLFLDDRGITDLRTVQAFGNFDHSALSKRIRTRINSKRSSAIASCVVRDKNQYRLFFSDKTAVYVTMDEHRVKGMMPVTLDHQITTIWSEEDPNGNEEIFFGADDGFVYQMEKGTSFDGANIFAYLYTHFDYSGSVQTLKEYFGPATIEGRGAGYAEFEFAYQLEFGQANTPQPNTQTAVMPALEGSEWDSGLLWDTGVVYDDTSLLPSVALDLRGEGQNISWIISKDSDYFEPLLLTGVHYRFIPLVPYRG